MIPMHVSAMIAGVAGLFLLLLPMSLQAQAVLAVGSLVCMFACMTRPKDRFFRFLTFTICSLLAIRYGFWRTTETLPSLSEPLNFIPGFILYLAEMYCLLMLFVSFFMLADPLKRKAPPLNKIEDLPTVDVYIPTYNEDAELLAGTVAAAKSMVYPKDKLKIWLLDDGGTDQKRMDKDPQKAIEATRRHEQLKALCEAMEINYLTRARNEHAKAGNMNEALKVTNGELVVVFDADHAPVRTFLTETVTYFLKNPKLFLVQTPHFFLNPDPLEKNLQTFGSMPSENEMFYSVVQTGLDKWDASFFCGSAAVLRRKALDEVGGFSGQSITEDCETALSLHAKGWHSAYVNKPLIAGLQPETFDAFIGQRARWCQGMLQILILNRPFLAKGLSIPQRICYAGINLFWLFPLSRMVFMFAPLLYIFFSLEIYNANIQEFCAYALSYLVASFGMQSYLHGKVRWPWISELYEYVQSVMLFGSIISVVRNPRKPTFNVTAKGITLEQNFISPIALPYFIIFFLLSLATLYSAWRLYSDPIAGDLLVMVAGWNVINLTLAAVGLGVVAERRELRRNQRLNVNRHGLLHKGGHTWSVLIKNASSGGVSVKFLDDAPDIDPTADWRAEIEVRRAGKQVNFPVSIRSVMTQGDEQIYGFGYTRRTTEVFMAIAEIMFSDQSLLQERIERRQVRQPIIKGSLVFLKRSLTEWFRALSYLAGFGRATDVTSKDDAPIVVKDNHSQISGRMSLMPQHSMSAANSDVNTFVTLMETDYVNA